MMPISLGVVVEAIQIRLKDLENASRLFLRVVHVEEAVGARSDSSSTFHVVTDIS